MRLRPLVLALSLAAAGTSARADPQPSAADVQAQLRAALGPLGGDAAPPEQQVRVTQEGDHMKVSIPFLAMMGMVPADAAQATAMTATARLMDGKWDIEDVRSPSPVTYAIKSPDGRADGHVTSSHGEETGHALFDPTLNGPSSISQIFRGFQSESVIGDLRQAQRIDNLTLQAGLTPRGDGRFDLDETAQASDIAVATQLPDRKTLEIAIDRGSFNGKLDQVRKDRVGPLAAVLYRVFAEVTADAGGPPGKLPPLDPAASQDLGAALDDLAAGGKVDESVDGLRVVAGGKRGGADHVSLGLGAAALNGDLTAYLDVAVDGLTLPDTPETAGLTPRHVALRPSVSGVDMHTLTELIRSASGPGANSGTLAMQAIGLVASGKLRVGIDSFALDMGDARFAGQGAVNIHSPSPQGVDGTARVTAEHFDAFIAQVQAQAAANPNVAKMIPGLIYAKGLAKNEDGKLVWNVAYAGAKLTVNGIDPTVGAPGKAAVQPPAKR